MTKHTPGPWFVEADTDIVTDDGDFIATTHDPNSDVGTQAEYDYARLIAAAPELLAALENVQTDAETLAGLDWSQALQMLRTVNKIARAAISKTTTTGE